MTHKFKVIVSLNNLPVQSLPVEDAIERKIDGKYLKNNGKIISESEMIAYSKRRDKLEHDELLRLANRRAKHILDWAQRKGLSGKEGIQNAINQGIGSILLELTGAEIKKLIDSNQDESILTIELWIQGGSDRK